MKLSKSKIKKELYEAVGIGVSEWFGQYTMPQWTPPEEQKEIRDQLIPFVKDLLPQVAKEISRNIGGGKLKMVAQIEETKKIDLKKLQIGQTIKA